jgi:hypothetical protein
MSAPKHGDKRFNCGTCGEVRYDELAVLTHVLNGHEVVLESYRNGKWYYNREKTVGDAMIEEMVGKMSPEAVEQFVARVEQMAGQAEHEMLDMRRN